MASSNVEHSRQADARNQKDCNRQRPLEPGGGGKRRVEEHEAEDARADGRPNRRRGRIRVRASERPSDSPVEASGEYDGCRGLEEDALPRFVEG
ncbi:hypothetical protein JCM18750_32460 [Halostagnicola bangensis]